MLIGSLKRRASRLVNATLEIMTRFGVRVNSPVIVALAFRLGFRMRGPLRSSLGPKDKVVVLTKPGGLEDIFQAFAEPPERFSLVLFNRRLLRAVSDHFLGAGLDDWVYNADDDPANRERSLRYREFLTRVVGLLARFGDVVGFIQFNCVYVSERELANTCREHGIKFVTLHKECLVSETAADEFASILQRQLGEYRGERIITYNQRIASAMIANGLVTDSQVTVSGCPRLDYSHDLRRDGGAAKGYVLYFGIQSDAGLYHLNYAQDVDSFDAPLAASEVPDAWGSLIERVNRSVLRLARVNPDIQIVFKVKPGHETQQMAGFDDTLPENLRVEFGGTGHTLLQGASLVIGFNTTAVLEAMAAGVPVVVPHLFDPHHEPLKRYLHEVEDGVSCPETAEAFEDMVLHKYRNPRRSIDLTLEQKSILETLMGNQDGKAAARCRASLEDVFSRAG